MFVFDDKDRDYIIIEDYIIIDLWYPFMCYLLFYVCFLGSRIISRISPYDDFYFVCVVGDHWLYVIMGLYIIIDLWFSFLGVVLGYGYIILVIWGLLDYLYHRTGIYLFDFFFVCVFWDECKGFFYYPWSMMSFDLNCVCWWEM